MNMFPITPTAYCISQGQNAICIISMLHIKRKWAVHDDSLLQKRSVSNPRKSDLYSVRFFLHLHLFDKAVSSDGKWVDKSRQKRWHGPTVGGLAVSLSINDIICPPDMSPPVTSVALRVLKKDKKGKKEIYFSIRAVWMNTEVRDTGGSLSVKTETCKCTDWQTHCTTSTLEE